METSNGEHVPAVCIADIAMLAGFVPDWSLVASVLGFGEEDISDIENAHHTPLERTKVFLRKWIDKRRTGATFEKLAKALEELGEHQQAADQIREYPKRSQRDKPTGSTGDNASIMNLKGKYCNFRAGRVDFPSVQTFSFTNLALIKDTTETKQSAFFFKTIQGSVDDIIETKETITYEDLVKSITSENRVLLLEGRPGCGKTTLTRKISKDWGEGAILTYIKYLFLIPLRHFHATPIIGLYNILQYFDLSELYSEITGNIGRGVCFIFDGLDEYSLKYTKDGQSWFDRLLRGEVLTSSIVITTSRPNASVELRESVHTRGEVLGFLKEQIDEYIDKCYPTNPSKAREVKTYLHNHQNIQHMCYVPLHLVMIIFIYERCEEEKVPLPITETGVYKSFTIMSLVRYYYIRKGVKIVLKDLHLIPSIEHSAFLSISKLAYNSTTASKTSISLQDIDGELSVEDLPSLGIIVVDEKEGISGVEPMLTFLHLTNQEFLAAYHLSILPSDEQLKAIRENIGQPHMGVVLKFFCGITGLQNAEHWNAIMDNALIEEYGNKKVNLRALHCVFESQNGQRCRDLFSKAGGELLIQNDTLSLLDYCVVGYCLVSAGDTVKKITMRCQLTAEGLQIVTQKLSESMDGVKDLEIQDDLCDEDKLLAVKVLLCRLPNLESLDMSYCFTKEGWSDWTWLADHLKNSLYQQTLVLDGNNLGPNGMIALCAAGACLSNLRVLNLRECNIGDEGMKALGAAAEHLSNLREIDLGNNKFGDDSIESLILIINHCYLEVLSLRECNISDELMKALLSAIAEHLSKLRVIDLYHCNICDEGIIALVAAAEHLSNLREMNLSGCNIGDKGMKALGAAAEHLSTLKRIDLMNNNLGDESIESLVHMINQCSLKELALHSDSDEWENYFSFEGTQFLKQRANSIRPEMIIGDTNNEYSISPASVDSSPSPASTDDLPSPISTDNPQSLGTSTDNLPNPGSTAKRPRYTASDSPSSPISTTKRPRCISSDNPS